MQGDDPLRLVQTARYLAEAAQRANITTETHLPLDRAVQDLRRAEKRLEGGTEPEQEYPQPAADVTPER